MYMEQYYVKGVQLNLDILNTDISYTMDMTKWFLSPIPYFLSNYAQYLEKSDISKFLNSLIYFEITKFDCNYMYNVHAKSVMPKSLCLKLYMFLNNELLTSFLGCSLPWSTIP